MAKITIEVGHGGADCGAIAVNGEFEKDIALEVALSLQKALQRHNIDVLMSRTTDCNDRAADFLPKAKAFSPDVGLSVHFNAFNGSASGFESFYRQNLDVTESKILCGKIAKEVGSFGIPFHGEPVKENSFLMQTLPCSTAYLEGCFIDNKADFALIDTLEKRAALGEVYAKGVLDFLGFTYKPPVTEPAQTAVQSTKSTAVKTVYRVIAGSYSVRENAEKHAEELKNKGVECFLAAYDL
jgi:N-acetylmuramoyl-L-alanine amidase